MRGDIPHPSEQAHWPCWFYPPETSEDDPASFGRIFAKAEDVPEGWAVNWRLHGVNLDREPTTPTEIVMTRSELRSELAKRDVAFSPTDAKAELQRLLDEAIEAEALDGSV